MEDKRKYPRFKVSDFNQLHGRMTRWSQDDKKLVTFGLGGCGFFGVAADPTCQPIRRVFCTFQFETASPSGSSPQTVEVQGNLIYLQTLTLDKREIYYYGIEFLDSHRPLVKPIVETLETLAKNGRIALA